MQTLTLKNKHFIYQINAIKQKSVIFINEYNTSAIIHILQWLPYHFWLHCKINFSHYGKLITWISQNIWWPKNTKTYCDQNTSQTNNKKMKTLLQNPSSTVKYTFIQLSSYQILFQSKFQNVIHKLVSTTNHID